MANPQKENGYTPIANELLEAVYMSEFTATELKMLLFVMRYTYGFSREEHQFSLTFISKGIGISKRYVSMSAAKLIEDNILTVIHTHSGTQGRVVKLNKNYDNWKNRTKIDQVNHSSTVELEFYSRGELEFHPRDELQFHQDKQYLKQNIKQGAFFQSLWDAYPLKKGLNKITDANIKSLLEVGYDTLKKCIDRYIADKPSWQSYQHGSTFFEKGYIDYLDENYLENSDIKNQAKEITEWQ